MTKLNNNKNKNNMENSIQGISTYDLLQELSVDKIFLTESQFYNYTDSRINGYTKSEALRFIRENIDYNFFEDEDNEKVEQYKTAVNNFFCHGTVMGVQSVEEALLVFEWIQARYSSAMPDVKLKYDSDKNNLQRYILNNLKKSDK